MIVLDGDGSLLMNLGSLVSIADAAVTNFYHFLSVNRTYEVNGAHPVPGADKVNFEDMARAAGYTGAQSFDGLDSLGSALPEVLRTPGPQMSVLKGRPG